MAAQVTTKEQFLREKLHNFAKFVAEIVPAAAARISELPDQPLDTIFVWVRAYLLPMKQQILKGERAVLDQVLHQTGFIMDSADISDDDLEKFCKYLKLFLDLTGN